MENHISNPLTLWNTSRTMASEFYESVSEGAVEFEQDVDGVEQVPELTTDVEQMVIGTCLNSDLSHEESVLEIQQIVYDYLIDELDPSFSDDRYNNQDVLSEWNEARTVASELNNWLDGDTDVPYHAIYTENPSYLPQTAEGMGVMIRSASELPESEQFVEITKTILARHRRVISVSETLATYFIDREYDNYQEVTEQFDDISFPPRSVSMMEVVNATGETREDRINAIADWVGTWYGNPDRVQDLANQRRRPMGMN